MKRLCAFALILAACSDTTPTTTDLLNINRPVDMAFACYGGLRVTNGVLPATPDEPVINTAQPIVGCDTRSLPHDISTPTPVPPGQEQITGTAIIPDAEWVGFILQSEPGTVAIATWATKPSASFSGGDVTVQDANVLTPGENGISVGENPVAIGTDLVGCKEVIANAGSCDMSILDINSAMAGGQTAIVDRLDVVDASGNKVRAKPAAMQMQPAAGTVGVQCGTTATGTAWVAYPNCHAVAAIDTATGKVQQSILFDASGHGTVDTSGNLSCPDECSGGTVTPGFRPVALSLYLDTRVGREVMAVGADNSNLLQVIDLDTTSSLSQSIAAPIALQQTARNDLGITSVTVSPQIGMGGTSGIVNDDVSVGGQSQFVYAVTTDNTVRVADILTLGKECDTEVDPRYLANETSVRRLSCLPVGDINTPPRRPLARGPGIQLIGDAIPTSVAISRVDPLPGTTLLAGDPARLIGYFAFITAANGATYVVNIDNDDFADTPDPSNPIGTPLPLDIAHQLRDAIPQRSLLATETFSDMVTKPICADTGPDPDATTGNTAGPRATTSPTLTLPAGSLASEKVVALPSVQQVACTGYDNGETSPSTVAVSALTFPAPVDVRLATFPDWRGLRGDETWTMTWEGTLSLDTAGEAIDGPSIRESQMVVNGFGAHMVDQTKPYCDAGVEPWDILQLRGCDPSLGDADCALGYTCFVHPQSKVTGLGACMLKNEADRLADACKEFLTSLRRYTVGKSTNGQLDLLPRKHALRTSPIDGCTDDAQCQTLANYTLTLDNSVNPVDDHTAADTHTWSCQLDPTRAPVSGTGKTCIETCAVDADCNDGTVCANGTCMESVVPPQACVNAAQRYELRVHDAFAVLGTKSGYLHPYIADANGACVVDPTASRLQIGRIPLTAGACDPTADPLTGELPGGGYEPNPCEETVNETETETSYPNSAAGSCVGGTSSIVTVPRDAIRFRNRGMSFDLVDPTYPGDKVCIGDRGANLGRIPTVEQDMQLYFRLTAGYSPLLVSISPSLPIKALTGPTQSIWVIDEGDYLSTSVSVASTRGKVYRFEAAALSIISLLE